MASAGVLVPLQADVDPNAGRPLPGNGTSRETSRHRSRRRGWFRPTGKCSSLSRPGGTVGLGRRSGFDGKVSTGRRGGEGEGESEG